MEDEKKDQALDDQEHPKRDENDAGDGPKLTESDGSSSSTSRARSMSTEQPSAADGTKGPPPRTSSKTKKRHSTTKPAKRKSSDKLHSKHKSSDKSATKHHSPSDDPPKRNFRPPVKNDDLECKPHKKHSTSKPAKRKSTDKPAKRKSTDKSPPRKVSESKPHKRKSTHKLPQRHYKVEKEDDASLSSSSSEEVQKTVDNDRKVVAPPPLPPKQPREEVKEDPPKPKEPDYLDPNFVPTCMAERRNMLIARAKKEAEEEAEIHQKRLEAARLNAQAELELKKFQVLENLRKKREEREKREQTKAKLRRQSIEKENEHFFEGVDSMNAQLLQRAEEFKASLEEQAEKGMIMIRPKVPKKEATPGVGAPLAPIMPSGSSNFGSR